MQIKQLVIDKLEELIEEANIVINTEEPNNTDMEWMDTSVSNEAY
ncbi:hypothetical protein [Orenia marismortui]|uniref:Uncharacterized protein n=1 Tax=Orenia marismortui TaxID=46469 RepID=A0A4R8GSZ9_9FIRM|nr:hypothetical protein [Orenia marismortui]TDX49143.1 hypothetical protein C7959_12037 [Orenia marismortui]